MACLLSLDIIFPVNLERYEQKSSIVLDKNNELLSVLLTNDGYWRMPITILDVDPLFIKMLIAYEDKRFYSHWGVDPFAMIRALLQRIQTGRIISGGSTLTLQTVRLLEPRNRTLFNKFIEILRAFQLEAHYTKEEILNIYLTLAPYGGNLEGIRAASLSYLNKEPKQLTAAEAALLVALPQKPSRLRPDYYPEPALKNRNKIIKRMEKIETENISDNNKINREKINILDKIKIKEALEDKIPKVKYPFPFLAPHLAFSFRMTKTTTTTIDKSLQKQLERLLKQQVQFLEPAQTISALVVENKTRKIIAYVGSADFFSEAKFGQVDIIKSYRSPGSTLKPFMYAIGFDQGLIHPETFIQDVPTLFSDYAPKNFKDIFHGTVTIREALQQSLNIPAVLVLERIGPHVFISELRKLGVNLKFSDKTVKPSLSVALGGVGINLYDLVSLYVALANQGEYAPLQLVENKKNMDPRLRGDDGVVSFISSESANAVTCILEGVAPPEGLVDWRASTHSAIAYKTGTSYGFRDAYAIGYTPDYTVGVWVGRPDGTPVPDKTGRTEAAPLLFKIFNCLPQKSNSGLIANINKPPENLVTFKPKGPTKNNNEVPFQILFPKEGMQIEMESMDSIKISLSGGKPPFYCLLNGRPMDEVFSKRIISWIPKTPGFWELTFIDSEGQSDSVMFLLTSPLPPPKGGGVAQNMRIRNL